MPPQPSLCGQAPLLSSFLSCHIKLEHNHSLQPKRHHFQAPEKEFSDRGPVCLQAQYDNYTAGPHKPSQSLSLHKMPLLKLEEGAPSWQMT